MQEDPGARAPGVHSAIDSIARGTTIMVLGTIALLLLGFIVRVELARHLTLESFGSFNLGLAFAGLLALVALLGLHQATARTLAEQRDPAVRWRLIRWVLGVTIVAATVASVAVYLLAGPIASIFDPADSGQLTAVFQLFSITVGLTLLSTFLSSVFQGFEDTFPNALINQAVQPAAFLVFVEVFFYFHLELTGALVAWVISNVITFLALVAYTLRYLPRHLPPVPPAARLPSGLWLLSASLWGVSTLSFVTAYGDTLILGAFRPVQVVGIYSAVMTLARLLLVASGAVTYIFLPVAARLKGAGDIASIRSIYATAGRWVLIFTVPMFLVFGLLPTDSATAIFGPSFAPGATALLIITTGALVSVALGPVNATLAGLGMTRPLLIATIVSATVNVVLSFALIPRFGLLGAAAAWSIARLLYPGVGALTLFTTHRISTLRREFLLPFALVLAIGVPLFLGIRFVPHPHWVIYPLYFVGVFLFIGVILATRTVAEGDFVLCRIAEKAIGRPLPRLRSFLERYSAAHPGP